MDTKDNSEQAQQSSQSVNEKKIQKDSEQQQGQKTNFNPNFRNNNNGQQNNLESSEIGVDKKQKKPLKLTSNNFNEVNNNKNKGQVVYVRANNNAQQEGQNSEEQKNNQQRNQQNPQKEYGQNVNKNNNGNNKRNFDKPRKDTQQNQGEQQQQGGNRRQGNRNNTQRQGDQEKQVKNQANSNQQKNEFNRGEEYQNEIKSERQNMKEGQSSDSDINEQNKEKKVNKFKKPNNQRGEYSGPNQNNREQGLDQQLPQNRGQNKPQSRQGGNNQSQQNRTYERKEKKPFNRKENADDNKQSQQQNRKIREEERLRREEQEGVDPDEQDIIDDGGAADEGEDQIFDISKENKNTLRDTLIKRLKRKKIDCPICYEKVGLRSSMWSCVQCYHPFHLECLKKWIYNSNKDRKNFTLYNWSCPNCQYIYSDKMPTYVCFCGKFKNPEFDPYINPHSCGDTCGKKRGNNCTHPCDISCHPGPCPPCTLKGDPIRCYCKKQKKDVFCSDNQTSYECGQQCQKILNCGKHFCEKNCHPGECSKCTQQVEAVCFCGEEKKNAICGQNLFACNRKCNKTLDCGNHKCQQQCHPGPCAKCELNPDDVDTCPCGKNTLLTLAGGNFREECTDPIPVCGNPCKKVLSCGVHICKKSCHEGPCPPCKESVEELCRCKFNSRIVQCYELREPDHQQFICDRVCKKLKSCNVHPCNTPCCPARKGQDVDGVHLCLKVCEKPLNCGKHNCELFCHLGICPKCPIKINEPIVCVCGKTSLAPPQPCGTKPPECHEPCSRQKPCGHPCHLECHQDECPPCEYKVDKVCHCGRQVVKDVSCSKDALCTVACNKVMSCGHKCETVCHVGDCPKDNPQQGCGRKCGRKRKFCEHICVSICHGMTECPQDPCKVEIVIKCKCGEREAFVECGSSDSALDRTLACNELCKNIKRFAFFHDKNKIYYPALLIRFAKFYMVYLLKIEKKIETFIKSNEKELTIPFQNDDYSKKFGLQSLLGKHYHLNVQYYNHFKQPYFVIEKSQDMVIPKMPLSEYYRKVEKGEIKPEVLPFEASIKFINNIRDDPNYHILENILRDFAKEYYVEKEDRQLVIHFWEKNKAEMASKKLQKSTTSYSNFTLEINERLVKEEESQLTAPNEVTRVKKRIITKTEQEAPQHSDDEEEKQLKLNKEQSQIIKQREQFKDTACLYEMCSQTEIDERSSRMLIDIFEQDPRTGQMQPYTKWMVKAYLRTSQTNTQPENIRPPDVLLLTTKYLVNKILDANFYVNVPFKYPRDKQGKRRSHTFDDIYNFISDRFKAIRQDITILNHTTEETIYVMEIICRFYAICLYECQNIEQGYDRKILIDDLQASLSQVLNMYQDINDYAYVDNKYEMYFYTLILNARDDIFINKFLATIPDPDHQKIKTALQIIDCVKNLDYFNFFLIVKQLDYIETCVVFNLFPYIRNQAVSIMRKSKLAKTVAEIQELFFFDSSEQTIEFLKSIGLDTSKLSLPPQYETDNEDELKKAKKQNDQVQNEADDNTKSLVQQQEQNSENLNQDQNSTIQQNQDKEKLSQEEKDSNLNQSSTEKIENSSESENKPKEEGKAEEEEKQIQEEKPKKYKLKKVFIDWKVIYENTEYSFKELNLRISDKKSIDYYPNYKQIKSTNNDNIVTRAFLVMGFKSKSNDKSEEANQQDQGQQVQVQEKNE
ncbi:hypothetical protein ABPG74_011740 [Tetrahymena malaccensis]